MKKALLVFCIGFLNLMNAQEHKEQFIVKAGTNTGFYSGKKSNWEGKMSYSIGIACEIPLSGKISFDPEINFARLNSESNRSEIWAGRNVTVVEKLKLSVISVPLIFKYNLYDKFKIQAGPQISYVAFAERERNNEKSEKPNAYIKDFDFGPCFGLSYSFTPKISVEARCFLGMADLDKNAGSFNVSTNSDIGKINMLSLTLGYNL